jgi:hypothetical protein
MVHWQVPYLSQKEIDPVRRTCAYLVDIVAAAAYPRRCRISDRISSVPPHLPAHSVNMEMEVCEGETLQPAARTLLPAECIRVGMSSHFPFTNKVFIFSILSIHG